MFNEKNTNQNKIFNTVYDHPNKLAVRCKIIMDGGTITNYLINIKDNACGITVLLDTDGNPMFSQIRH